MRRWLSLPFALLIAIDPGRGIAQDRSPAVRLDHIIIVVPDLDSAAAPLARLGFRFKPGRLHSSNLINRHIKFRDGTGIELMSLAGPPKDSMAMRYRALLDRGPGGAYVALRTDSLELVALAAHRLGLETRRTSLGPWQFLGFPGPSDASAVFFVAGGAAASDPDSVLAHPNGALSLEEAWVEGGPLLDSLMSAVGGMPAEGPHLPQRPVFRRWQLASGRVVVVPPAEGAVPRPFGSVLRKASGDPQELVVHHELPSGMWSAFRGLNP